MDLGYALCILLKSMSYVSFDEIYDGLPHFLNMFYCTP